MTIHDVYLKTGSPQRAVYRGLKALANANGVPRSDRRTQRLFLFRINLFIISVWMVSSAKRQVRSAVVISQSCRSEKRFHPPAERPKVKQQEETNQVAANKHFACLLI